MIIPMRRIRNRPAMPRQSVMQIWRIYETLEMYQDMSKSNTSLKRQAIKETLPLQTWMERKEASTNLTIDSLLRLAEIEGHRPRDLDLEIDGTLELQDIQKAIGLLKSLNHEIVRSFTFWDHFWILRRFVAGMFTGTFYSRDWEICYKKPSKEKA